MPLISCAPDQAPVAVQAVALVEDQVSVVLCPALIVVGATEIATVGVVAEDAVNLATKATFSIAV